MQMATIRVKGQTLVGTYPCPPGEMPDDTVVRDEIKPDGTLAKKIYGFKKFVAHPAYLREASAKDVADRKRGVDNRVILTDDGERGYHLIVPEQLAVVPASMLEQIAKRGVEIEIVSMVGEPDEPAPGPAPSTRRVGLKKVD